MQRRRAFGSLLALGSAVVLVVSACSSSGNSGGSGGSKKAVKFAGLFAESGPNQVVEQPFEQGVKLALDQQPGVIDVKYYDTAADPATAVKQFNAAYSRDQITNFLGAIFSTTALAVDDSAKKKHALYFATGSSAPALTTPLSPLTFALNPPTNVQMAFVAKFASTMNVKKIGMIYETDSFGTDALNGIKAAIGQYGIQLVATQGIATDATTAAPQVAAMQAAHVDAVVLGTIVGPSLAVLKQAQSVGMTTPLLNNESGIAPSLTQQATRARTPAYYAVSPLACPIDPLLTGACAQNFANQYKAKYKTAPGVYDALGYAGTVALIEAVKKAKSGSPKDIAASLETNGPFTTSVETLQWSSSSHLSQPTTNMQGVVNGKVSFFGSDATNNTL